MEWRECQKAIYEEIKELKKLALQQNEQITILRIETAEHRIKIDENKRLHSSIWGILGGAISAGTVAVVDFMFRK